MYIEQLSNKAVVGVGAFPAIEIDNAGKVSLPNTPREVLTQVTLANATQHTFSVPSWATEITVTLIAAVCGTGTPVVTLGVGGVPQTTGYLAHSVACASTNTVVSASSTTGFFCYGANGEVYNVSFTVTKGANNIWGCALFGNRSGWGILGGGTCTLLGVADTIRVASLDAFTSGSIRVTIR